MPIRVLYEECTMNFFKSLLGGDKSLVVKSFTQDILSNEGLKIFYLSREAIQAFLGSEGVGNSRVIANDSLKALENFLSYQYSQYEIDYLEQLWIQNTGILKKNTKNKSKGLYQYLNDVSPSGAKLLKLPTNIDLEVLKKCYRTACLLHHPDRGGSDELMKQVNEAYSLFHDAISFYVPEGENFEGLKRLGLRPETWNQHLYACYLVASCIYADQFAADKILQGLRSAYEILKKDSNSYIGQFALEMQMTLYKVPKAFGRFLMESELKEVSEIVDEMLTRACRDQVRDEWGGFLRREDLQSKESFYSYMGLKIVLMTPEQAENSYRLGKIDLDRYEKTLKKFDLRREDKDKENVELQKLYNSQVLIQKLNLDEFKTTCLSANIVSPPRYGQVRFEFLDEDQKFEYIKAFGPLGNPELLRKYLMVRAHEILLGMIQNFDNLDISKIEAELSCYVDNVQSYNSYLASLLDFTQFLKREDSSSRANRLRLLADLDDPEMDSSVMVIVISLTSIMQDNKMKIRVSENYFDFAKSELKDIESYKKSGKINSSKTDSWNKDLELIAEFQETAVGKKRWDLDVKKPEEVTKTLEEYLKGLLEVGVKIHPKHTGQLQIGWEINRITTAYAKLKNWERVVYWSDLFLNFPSAYRERSSSGEQEKIKSRLEKAQVQLSKKAS